MTMDARRISREVLRERRHQAVRLHEAGHGVVEIAALVGAHRNTVTLWLASYQRQGEQGLEIQRIGRPTGSGRRLTSAQENTIRGMVVGKHPEQMKLPFALWTRDAVRQLVKERLDIDLPVRTMGLYLKRWNMTPQKPLARAYERNPKAIQKWLEDEYPLIQAMANKEDAEIHWGDQTGIRSEDQVGRGYAPRGQTPVCRTKGTPEKVNMMSTVTNRGTLRFMFYEGSMNASRLIDFLGRLVRGRTRKIYLILDNLRVHHSKKVKAWAAAHAHQIKLFYLPSYCPDLNPDEHLNNDLKSRLRNLPQSRQKGQLKTQAQSVMRKLQKSPEHVQSYFQHHAVHYAR